MWLLGKRVTGRWDDEVRTILPGRAAGAARV